MKIAVTGSHGLIARHLLPALDAAGHQVVKVVRGQAGAGELHWDPAAGELDGDALEGVDAVVHLAGKGIFGRWSETHKAEVRNSRLQGTALLADRLAGLSRKPATLVSGSAVGYYGDRGSEVLTEVSQRGRGFLADLVEDWEAATAAAEDAGIRTVKLRTGIVCAADGGALKLQLPVFKLGVGGRLGSGEQWFPWVSIDDEVGAILHALDHDSLSGPVNLAAPEPVTNAEFTRALGEVLHRPTALAVPAVAIRTVLGREMADETLLVSQRVQPVALDASGYRFRHPEVRGALRAVLDR
jgi:uncharacterized protein (TIGR01777 family)